ncbi:hypothetical protein [Herpetosiphon sp. NSE202]|uniref:hypothetical protein n=1 Tax=Herpetosiphon sp. NSE202 TaxID=3351349 RepID=UPI0036455C15
MRKYADALLLLLWVGHVLIYAMLAPPWQHYDEPTHFEYIALIRKLDQIPSLEVHDHGVRRAIAASMLEEGFFASPHSELEPFELDDPELTLGFNERTHPALYYWLAATLTTPFQSKPVVDQLRAARLLSVLLATLFFYSVVRLIAKLQLASDVQSTILATLAFNPALADTMSSVNSDVLANLVAVWLFAASLRFAQRPSWRWLVVGLSLMLLAWNVKRMLVPFALIVPLGWLMSLPPIYRWRIGAALGLGLVFGCYGASQVLPRKLAAWTSVAANYEPGFEPQSTTIVRRGTAAFQLDRPVDGPGPMLEQEIAPFLRKDLAGQVLTLSGWMRTDREGILGLTPALQYNQTVVHDSIYLGTTWKYVSITTRIPTDTTYLAVRLSGPLSHATIFYDSLTLIAGYAPGDDATPDGELEKALLDQGVPQNFLRNSDAELQIPLVPSAMSGLTSRHIDAQSIDRMLEKAVNPEWIRAVYPRQALALFQGFWGVFGWGEISVSAGWFTAIGLLVGLGLVGAMRQSYRFARQTPGDLAHIQPIAWWMICLAVGLGWAMAFLRVHLQPIQGAFIWSFGRYTFVAVVPSLIILVVGLRSLFPPHLRRQGLVGMSVFLGLFASMALISTLLPYWTAFKVGL